MKRVCAGALVAALVLPGILGAQEPPKPRVMAWTFYDENDVFAGTDQHYTQGFKFTMLREQKGSPKWIEKLAPILWSAFGNEKLPFSFNGGWSVGQNIYTPEDIEQSEPQPDDRPWAGWLYVGRMLQVSSDCDPTEEVPADAGVVRCREQQHTFEADVGVVGPLSQAEAVQTGLHEVLDNTPPKGWDNQIKNEPGLLLLYTGKWRFPNRSQTFDATPTTRIAVGGPGAVLAFASAGGTVRFGRNLSGFTGSLIPSVQRQTRPRWDAYVFAGAEARLVGVNVFLDGNYFHDDSPSAEKEPFVYDLTGGGSIRYKSFRMTYTLVQRSPEFEPPSGRDLDPQNFGSLALSWEKALP